MPQSWNCTISCSSSAALDAGNYADGSTSMTIIDVATRFADPSLGLFASLGLKATRAMAGDGSFSDRRRRYVWAWRGACKSADWSR
jgi:hypothetical protein